ncbi:hypothetical protein UFOVP73_40 [uncultured Caudovirales phage]|uniref:Uncharacterized protein n=1 Tax=uncultured Caudovirales phage TaxID=2100421 RepID=A0A6J7WGA2_9CAUD|nr:hypothetical protein UFOVP73_40 [uncultured Caudovirales phage]CAB5195187.1 hypothetical protein UFOVP170_62 [uncultured Caudovirales phage]
MPEKLSNKSRGGARPGAGRKPGIANRKTAEQVASASVGGMTPLEYLLSVMRAPETEPRDRLTAANAAAPYVHAKLASITVAGDINHKHRGFIELPPKRG